MVRDGKGGKDRSLWLSPQDLELVKDWLTHRPGEARPRDPLFTRLDGQKPICERWFRDLIYRLTQQAGIVKRISPHSLRHSFACDLLRATKNLFLVSKALGHADLATTQIYLHLVDGEMEEALKGLRN
jgi:site-specific recombinase XerD